MGCGQPAENQVEKDRTCRALGTSKWWQYDATLTRVNDWTGSVKLGLLKWNPVYATVYFAMHLQGANVSLSYTCNWVFRPATTILTLPTFLKLVFIPDYIERTDSRYLDLPVYPPQFYFDYRKLYFAAAYLIFCFFFLFSFSQRFISVIAFPRDRYFEDFKRHSSGALMKLLISTFVKLLSLGSLNTWQTN